MSVAACCEFVFEVPSVIGAMAGAGVLLSEVACFDVEFSGEGGAGFVKSFVEFSLLSFVVGFVVLLPPFVGAVSKVISST